MTTTTAPARAHTPDTHLLRVAGLTFVIQILATVTSFVAQIVLVPAMGKTQFGLYTWVMPWTSLVALLSPVGLGLSALQLLPRYRVERDFAAVRSFVRFGLGVSLSVSMLAAGITAGLCAYAAWHDVSPFALPLLLGTILFPLFGVAQFQIEALRGLSKILGPLIVMRLLPQVVILAAGGTALWLGMRGTLTAAGCIFLTAGSMLAAVTVAHIWLRTSLRKLDAAGARATPGADAQALIPPASAPAAVLPRARRREWLTTSLAMFFFNIAYGLLVFSDMMLMPLWMKPEEVAVYGMAQRIASVSGLVLLAVNTVAAPQFAEFHARGDKAGLQRYIFRSSHWLFWPTLGLAVALLVGGRPLLALLGPVFVRDGYLPLVFLVCGQLVNVGTGSVGYLMLMTGHHARCATIFIASATINICLQAFVAPRWGITGVAAAMALTMCIWNLVLYGHVVWLVGVRPSIVDTILAGRAGASGRAGA